MNENLLIELQPILATQHKLLKKIQSSVKTLEKKLSQCDSQKDEIQRLECLIKELEQEADYLQIEDFPEWEKNGIEKIYQNKFSKIKDDLSIIDFKNWDSFVINCIRYCNENGIDPFIPYATYLTKTDLTHLKKESFTAELSWDQWDYIFVGTAGVFGALTDFFLVNIPKDVHLGVYTGQKGSLITKWLHSLKMPQALQKWLELSSRVPFDNTGGSSHRIDTLGHDPVLSFIFGVTEIMTKGIPSDNGYISIKNPVEALFTQFLHLISDVTTKRGLPVPFAPVLRLLNYGSFSRPNGKTATISQLVSWMYHHGYDLRHFITMGITPATIEIILRFYIMIRHYFEKGDTPILLANNPKYRTMLLTSHAIAAATNIGKICLNEGNPLAINYAEWIALFRYLVPSLKYWLFDKNRLTIENMNNIIEDDWNQLVINSYEILRKVNLYEIQTITLGISQR